MTVIAELNCTENIFARCHNLSWRKITQHNVGNSSKYKTIKKKNIYIYTPLKIFHGQKYQDKVCSTKIKKKTSKKKTTTATCITGLSTHRAFKNFCKMHIENKHFMCKGDQWSTTTGSSTST